MVVGKPPAATVADAVRAHADRLATPVRLALLGPGQADLAAAVRGVLAALGVPAPVRWPQWTVAPAVPTPRPGALRGLYAGGSLCDEAMVIASAALGPVASNIPLRPQWRLAGPGPGTAGHWMLDLGDDGYTRGRPHPMIDGGPRRDLLDALAGDEQCAVVLLDVVLGHGADPDPAATLAPAVAAARHRGAGRGLAVVVALVGTRGDPQDLAAQAGALRAAGADVFAANADAARHAVALATGEPR